MKHITCGDSESTPNSHLKCAAIHRFKPFASPEVHVSHSQHRAPDLSPNRFKAQARLVVQPVPACRACGCSPSSASLACVSPCPLALSHSLTHTKVQEDLRKHPCIRHISATTLARPTRIGGAELGPAQSAGGEHRFRLAGKRSGGACDRCSACEGHFLVFTKATYELQRRALVCLLCALY